jgi:hypothetical protein
MIKTVCRFYFVLSDRINRSPKRTFVVGRFGLPLQKEIPHVLHLQGHKVSGVRQSRRTGDVLWSKVETSSMQVKRAPNLKRIVTDDGPWA